MQKLLTTSTGCLLGLLWFCPASPALEPNPIKSVESEYVVESWQTENGLPDDFINDVAQSPDGYLWILTFNGLCRFNGTEFVTFDAANTLELSSSRLTEEFLDRKGRLWIKSETGSWVYWWKGHFKSFSAKDGLPAKMAAFGQEGDEIWLGASNHATNYYRLEQDRFLAFSGSTDFSERFGTVTDLRGRGWTIESNVLCCVDASNPVAAPIPGFKEQGWRLLPARDGGIWVIANRIEKYSEGQWQDWGPLPVGTDRFTSRAEDHEGNLWVGTDLGEIWRFKPNGETTRFRLPGKATSQLGRGFIEDAEGDLWLGTGGGGLFRIKARAFRNYGVEEGLASPVVRSVTEDRAGNIWFASVDRVDWLPIIQSSSRAQSRGLNVVLPWEVLGTRDGSLWVGTFAEGLYHVTGDVGQWMHCFEPGFHDPPINAMFEERNGELDLGTPRGLYRVRHACLSRADTPAGIPQTDVRAIAQDSSGRLYLGLESCGLLRKSATGWEHFTTQEGLADDHIRALWVDPEDSVWIGTHGRGLTRFKAGRFFNFTQEPATRVSSFDLPKKITSILEDNSGDLWLASNRGLFRANRQQLNHVADGISKVPEVIHYDRSDGMGSSQCVGDHQPAAWKCKDGRLWFATMDGAVLVEPKTLSPNSRPPPVVIETVQVDDALQAPAPDQDQVIAPAGTRRLEFRYAALSFNAPAKVRFRYRLDGFDKDWVEAGNRRTAYYTKIPPGPYRFDVIAANSDNVWNRKGASLGVRVLPLFWQTTWFQALIGLAVVAAGFFGYHVRVRRLYQQRALQESFSRRLIESQETERKRMAAELHDSLGQNLLVVNNDAAMALRELSDPQKAGERLRKITKGAAACIEEVRSVARSLRPYQLDRFGLTKTLEDLGELLSNTAGLQITTEVENIDGLLSSDAEISVYRIAQEWLNNVIKHAQAKRARLIARREPGWLRLILEDNGVGFDYAAVMARVGEQKSFGLLNLCERARLLGGQAEVQARIGKGTRLLINIPYVQAPGGSNR